MDDYGVPETGPREAPGVIHSEAGEADVVTALEDVQWLTHAEAHRW